ncbi:hypothetical protein [Paraburkholderia sp. RL17-373-BIF-A]
MKVDDCLPYGILFLPAADPFADALNEQPDKSRQQHGHRHPRRAC